MKDPWDDEKTDEGRAASPVTLRRVCLDTGADGGSMTGCISGL